MRHVTPRYISDSARKTATRFPHSSGFDYQLDMLIHEYAPQMPDEVLQSIKDATDVGEVTDILDAFLDEVGL